MKSLLKWLLGGLAVVLGVVIVALIALTLLLDPNDFRPQLEKLAREQGVELKLNGDISWRFWPRLQLSVNQVVLGDTQAPLLKAQRLSGQVAIAPLLQGQVVVEALEVAGADIALRVDKQGKGNWESLVEAEESADRNAKPGEQDLGNKASASADNITSVTSTTKESPPTDSGSVSLAIESLTISDSALRYTDNYSNPKQPTDVAVSDVQLTVTGFDVDGQLFQWQQSMNIQLPQKPLVTLSSEGLMGVNLAEETLKLQDMRISASANKMPLNLQLSGNVEWQQPSADVSLQIPQVNLGQWLTQMGISLPDMAAADALGKFSLKAHIKGEQQTWLVDQLAMVLDDTQFNGTVKVVDSAVDAQLSGDSLDLDRYLPVPATQAPAQASSSPASGNKSGRVVPLLDNEPLPLDDLRDVKAALQLKMGQIQYQQLPITNVVLKLKADGKSLQMSQLSLNINEGALQSSGGLTLAGAQSPVQLKANLSKIPVKLLLSRLADESRLDGLINGNMAFNTKGQSLRQWQQNLQGKITVDAQSLTLADVDIERSACELASLVNREAVPNIQWKGLTQLQNVDTVITINGDRVDVNSLQAGVENLQVKATGDLQLNNGKFDFPLDVAFTGTADASRKCQIRDRWRNRDLPIRCAGNVNDLSAKVCLPDSKRIDDLLRDELKQKASEKLQEKIKEKLGDSDKAKAVENVLRGLFGQ